MRRALLIGTLVSACGRSDKTAASAPQAKSDIVSAVARAVTAPAPAPAADPCPHNGLWATCSVERRLRQAGFVARKIDGQPQKRAGFSVMPTVYSLGKSRLELFFYDNEASLSHDMTALDTLLVSPLGATVSQFGETSPVLIRSANLAAVLLSASARQVERLALAITAGAPQPGSPR